MSSSGPPNNCSRRGRRRGRWRGLAVLRLLIGHMTNSIKTRFVGRYSRRLMNYITPTPNRRVNKQLLQSERSCQAKLQYIHTASPTCYKPRRQKRHSHQNKCYAGDIKNMRPMLQQTRARAINKHAAAKKASSRIEESKQGKQHKLR